jgi:hypothetical protein
MDRAIGRESRTEGNPNERDSDRESSRLGSARSPEDIPKQDSKVCGHIVKGTVDEKAFRSTREETGRDYRVGAGTRPNIVHDNGHLTLGRRDPVAADYAAMVRWRAMLAGGEALRPDLSDGLAAYRHFLDGKGKPRTFSYERYVMADWSGQITLGNAVLDFQDAVQRLFLAHPDSRQFPITGPAIPCGTNSTAMGYIKDHFPYPSTENWQKTIGSHFIWLSGEVKVYAPLLASGATTFEASMILHAEDRYNFNPGDHDAATDIPDSENGRFERIGWGHQFDHFSTLQRHLRWDGFSLGIGLSVRPNTVRVRQPTDNRRLRNRL